MSVTDKGAFSRGDVIYFHELRVGYIFSSFPCNFLSVLIVFEHWTYEVQYFVLHTVLT